MKKQARMTKSNAVSRVQQERRIAHTMHAKRLASTTPAEKITQEDRCLVFRSAAEMAIAEAILHEQNFSSFPGGEYVTNNTAWPKERRWRTMEFRMSAAAYEASLILKHFTFES